MLDQKYGDGYWADPDPQDAKLFCKDAEMFGYEWSTINQYVHDIRKIRVLDAGCGNPENTLKGLQIAEGNVTFIDRSPFDTRVKLLDLRDTDGMEDLGQFGCVLCKRVLTNIPQEDRELAFQNLLSVVKPGGSLVLVDVFADEYRCVQQCRESLGLDELSPCNTQLERSVFGNRSPYHDVAIAANYYYYTRVLAPAFTGRSMPYTALARVFAPVIENADKVGVHRLLVFGKAK